MPVLVFSDNRLLFWFGGLDLERPLLLPDTAASAFNAPTRPPPREVAFEVEVADPEPYAWWHDPWITRDRALTDGGRS